MNWQNYSKTETEINNVLVHQTKKLSKIERPSMAGVNECIHESEKLLQGLGYRDKLSELKSEQRLSTDMPRKVIVVPSWENLCAEAEKCVGTGHTLEDIFSPEELEHNGQVIRQINEEYNALHRLDRLDITICAIAGLLGAAIDILLIGIPKKTPGGLKGGPLANYVRDWFDKKYPPEEMERVANSKASKVPYDAQDNRNTNEYVDGLSTYYHRLLSLGHDPLLGLFVGVYDILNGRMTTIDKTGKIVSQVMENYADRKESDIFAAIAKQLLHFKSDVTTAMGLPAPMMGLFNLLQFGSIGEENQTIAEIVQGMYYEGYDSIHFITLSIPVMIVEVVIRLCYAIKRIKEGHSIKDSIPFSLNRAKNPKLGTMVFIGHSAATAINAGKVYFTENPMAINYPQWLAFGKYSYQQLKWILLEKPSARDAYVRGVLNEDFNKVFNSVNETFDEITANHVVVFE